jgi:transcription termination factor NusB
MKFNELSVQEQIALLKLAAKTAEITKFADLDIDVVIKHLLEIADKYAEKIGNY